MTLALAIVLFGLLLLYCGIKGKSLRHALIGRGVDASSGALLSK